MAGDLLDIGTLGGAIELDNRLESTLEVAIHQVENFADKFTGVFGGLTLGAGLVGTAILGVAGTISKLAIEGSALNDIESGFNRLSGDTENAERILAAYRRGVNGTITDVELMRRANSLLGAGVKGNADDFESLTTAARVLANQGYGPLESIMSQIDRAMMTGNASRLKRIGINVDTQKAERDYAAAIGLTAQQLSNEQSMEAKRAAIIAATTKVVRDAGEQTTSFADKVSQVYTSIANWSEDLQKKIASSTSVNRAFETIKTSIADAFGGGSQTLLDWVVKWTDRFANAVETYGPPIIETLGDIKDWVVYIWDAVERAWDAVPDWLKFIARDAALAAGGLWAARTAIDKLTEGITGVRAETSDWLTTLGNLGTITDASINLVVKGPLSGLIGSMRTLGTMMRNRDLYGGAFGAMAAWVPGLAALREKINLLDGSTGALGGTFMSTASLGSSLFTQLATGAVIVGSATAVVTAGYQAWNLWTESRERARMAEGFAAQEQENLKQINAALGTSYTRLQDAMDASRKRSEELRGAQKELTEEEKEAEKVTADYTKRLDALHSQLVSLTNTQSVTHEAFSKLTAVQWENVEVQRAMIDLLAKEIELGNGVTVMEQSRVAAALRDRAARMDMMQAQLEQRGATVEEINTMKELGATTKEIGLFFGVSGDAVEKFAQKQQKASELTRSSTEAMLGAELSKHHDNVNDWIALETEKYENTIARMREAGTATQQMLDMELAKHNQVVDAEMQKRAEQSQFSRAHFQAEYDVARNKLEAMLAMSQEHTDAEIRLAYEEANAKEWALNHWTQVAGDQIAALEAKSGETANKVDGIGQAANRATGSLQTLGSAGSRAVDSVAQAAEDAANHVWRLTGQITFALDQLSEAQFKAAGGYEKLRAIEESYRMNPGRKSGGSGTTGLNAGDAIGYSKMLEEQQLYAQLKAYADSHKEGTTRKSPQNDWNDQYDSMSGQTSQTGRTSSSSSGGGPPGVGGTGRYVPSPVQLPRQQAPPGGVTFGTGSIVINNPIFMDQRHLEQTGRIFGDAVMNRMGTQGRRLG